MKWIKLFESFNDDLVETTKDILVDISDDGIHYSVNARKFNYSVNARVKWTGRVCDGIYINIGKTTDIFTDIPMYKYVDNIIRLDGYLTENGYELFDIEYYLKPENVELNDWVNSCGDNFKLKNIEKFIKVIEDPKNWSENKFKFIFIKYVKDK